MQDDETSYLDLLNIYNVMYISEDTRACLRPNEEKLSFYFYVYFVYLKKENEVKWFMMWGNIWV